MVFLLLLRNWVLLLDNCLMMLAECCQQRYAADVCSLHCGANTHAANFLTMSLRIVPVPVRTVIRQH
jgi:hypothetical protein